MNLPSGWELILVVVLIMVLFGYKRLPDATRSLGKSMRIFKAETKGLKDDDLTTTTTTAHQVGSEQVAPAVPLPPVVAPDPVEVRVTPAEQASPPRP